MDKYTIYCTQEQTRKTLELGAPIKLLYEKDSNSDQQYLIVTAQEHPSLCYEGYCYAKVPTVEQMLGWLNDKGIFIHINFWFDNKSYTSEFITHDNRVHRIGIFNSYKDAALAAIDESLNYLTKLYI